MITQNEDRNRKTKYGHKREGNTGHGKHRSDTNPVFRNSYNISATISVFDMGISDEEWESLQKALDWPGPGKEITQLNLSTSPVHSTFSIVGLKNRYKVGEKDLCCYHSQRSQQQREKIWRRFFS